MKDKPLVSVVMPVYNGEKYLAEAIKSILNQTYKNFEFIIVDDGSTDRSAEIIQKYAKKDKRVMYLKNPKNLRICKTLNRGIKAAKGKYIARMDADDWSYPYRLDKQVRFMEENQDVVVSGGTMDVCDMSLNKLNERQYNLTDRDIRNKLFFWSPFCHGTTIYRKKEFLKSGGYDPHFDKAQDYDLWFRLGKLGKFANLSAPLYKMRVNTKSSTYTAINKQEKFTLEIRRKAVKEYGYSMRFLDTVYYLMQSISMWIMPPEVKYKLFNFLRRFLR